MEKYFKNHDCGKHFGEKYTKQIKCEDYLLLGQYKFTISDIKNVLQKLNIPP